MEEDGCGCCGCGGGLEVAELLKGSGLAAADRRDGTLNRRLPRVRPLPDVVSPAAAATAKGPSSPDGGRVTS